MSSDSAAVDGEKGIDAPTLTAVVLTLNEARHLPDCLLSLAWADRILVLDSGSQDDTLAIAHRAGAEVAVHRFENYSRQRQHALGLVDGPWILFVDADERVPADLAEEIQRVVVGADAQSAYRMPRHNEFFGRRLRGGGWWPDEQLRLLRVDRARFDPERAVHELAEISGPIGRLQGALRHINYESRREFHAKQRAYAGLEVQRRLAEGQRPRPHNLVLQPLRELRRRLWTLAGWRDGALGLELALSMAAWELWTLLELSRIRRSTRP
jgi:glycosyltransferase involved in cell wall biosynthesis